MLATAVRTVAVVASLILVASFGLFARDQIAQGSQEQQAAVTEGPVSAPAAGPRPPAPETQPRRAIDDAARTLLTPFSPLATASSGWGARTLPTLAALLVYGFGFGVLSRAAPLSGSTRSRASRT